MIVRDVCGCDDGGGDGDDADADTGGNGFVEHVCALDVVGVSYFVFSLY